MGRAKHRKLKKAGTKTLVSLDTKLPSRRPPEHQRFREQQIAKEKMAKKKRKAPGSHPPIKSHGDLPTPKQRSPAAVSSFCSAASRLVAEPGVWAWHGS